MTKVAYFYGSQWWARAHREGCADTHREARRDSLHRRPGDDGVIETEVESLRQLIEEAAGDFIFFNDQQPWTDYIDEVSIAPCLKLPREGETDG